MKWHLWPGNVFRALELLNDIEDDLYCDNPNITPGEDKGI